MRRQHFIRTGLLAAVLLLALTGCRHKGLDFGYTGSTLLDVIFDWTDAPDADPEEMNFYLYPQSGSDYLRYDLVGKDGGTIKAPLGSFDSFCYNSDGDYIVYRNTDSYDTFELTTNTTELTPNISNLGMSLSSAPRASGTEDQRVAHQPDSVWTSKLENVILEYDGTDDHSVTLYPHQAFITIEVEIHNCENLQYVLGVDASLSGLSGGWLPGLDKEGTELVTVPFSPSISDDYTTLSGKLTAFGHCPDGVVNEHILMVYVVLGDGNGYSYSFDVTEDIHESEDQVHIILYLDSLPVPKPIVNGGGFKPEVGDWDDVVIDIPM